ncbi:hypothetical protein [Rhizobium sp. G21]|uniref:hypothetical protein n=1 Tax=Rhizobium sp. G21 TaxID=2758439 RepID=UPI0016048217|nr:hypothetical protein [Rhizobium sp. G21]MBB1248460.1 hypothetical protein [Rhizobium sp. G21]
MAGVSHVYGNFASTVAIDTDGDAWTFKLGGISPSAGPGIQMVDGAEGNVITVHANVRTIAEFESAVVLSGSDWFMSISSLAEISGYNGLYIDGGASGTTSFLVNDGDIIANGGAGVTMAPKAQSPLSITNSGLISGWWGSNPCAAPITSPTRRTA